MSAAAAATNQRAEIGKAMRALDLKGYDVTYVGGSSFRSGKYRVTRPRHENAPSYFDAEGLIALAATERRSEFMAAIEAARVVNPHFPVEEIPAMSAAEKSVKSGKRSSGPIPKPGERKRASKKAAPAETGEQSVVASTKKSVKAAKPAGEKKAKASREVLGASVKGASPELLKYLAGFQEQTIERMNGGRVVELAVAVMGATLDNPVTRKSLTVYPQRIAREMVRLGIFRQENVDEVGLCYFPANGLRKLAAKQ